MTFVTILSADLLGEMAEDLILELSNKMLMLFLEFRINDIDNVSIQIIFKGKLSYFLNSLLPVSRYIDTTFADEGSHKKKINNQNVRTHLSSDY